MVSVPTLANDAAGAGNITLRQSLIPVALVTILFFLWGFAYGLLDVLNAHFQVALNITRAKSGGLQAAYFGAYAVAPLTYSGWLVRRCGYKWTFIAGLCIYGVGALMFWPSAVKRSFGGFVGSMFIVGSGLATLETAANPYIALCGPSKYSEIRLTLSQSFQAVGTVVAPVLASYVIFKNVDDTSLESVQWIYLGIACFVFALSVVFYFAPIPEITDGDTAAQVELQNMHDAVKPLSQQYMLFYGVAAQFCYVGAQCAYAGYFINYVEDIDGRTHDVGSKLLSVAQACFAVGRFVATGLLRYLKPRLVLLFFLTGVLITGCICVAHDGKVGLVSVNLILFFESCVFPLIFTISLRGLGKHSKRGGSFIVAAVRGGALFPPLLGLASDRWGTQKAFFVPLIGVVLAWTFPLYINLLERKHLDGYLEKDIEVSAAKDDLEQDFDIDRKKSATVNQYEISQ